MKSYQRQALAAMPIRCEYCKTRLKRTKKDVDLWCPNEACSGPLLKTFEHFFRTIKVDGLGPGELEKIIGAGFDTIPKIIRVRADQLQRLDKFAAKKAGKLSRGLNKCLDGVKLAKLMDASGLFKDENSGLGETKLQWIIDEIGTQKILSMNLDMGPRLVATLTSIKGIAQTSAEHFVNGINAFRTLYAQIQNSTKLAENKKLASSKLLGEGFCFTGFRDQDMVNKIEANGGKITGGVTGATTVLFAAKSSKKTMAAEQKGVKIVAQVDAANYLQGLLK